MSRHWTARYGLKGRTIYRLLDALGWENAAADRTSVTGWAPPSASPMGWYSTRRALWLAITFRGSAS